MWPPPSRVATNSQRRLALAAASASTSARYSAVSRGPRVVHERDLAGVALVAQRAQHRQHRRDAAAATDQHQLARPRCRQHEVALRGAEMEDRSGTRSASKVARHDAVGMARHRQLDRAVAAVLRAGRRVGARAADAVDLDPHGARTGRPRSHARPGWGAASASRCDRSGGARRRPRRARHGGSARGGSAPGSGRSREVRPADRRAAKRECGGWLWLQASDHQYVSGQVFTRNGRPDLRSVKTLDSCVSMCTR